MNSKILSIFLVAAVALMSSACATQLPEYAPKMDTVKVTTNVESKVASVDMNKQESSSSTSLGKLVDAADTAATAGAHVKIRQKLNENIDVMFIQEQTQASFEEALGDGPPFGVATEEGDGRIELNVLSWGMERKDSMPVFVFILEPETYFKGKDDSIYAKNENCKATEGIWGTENDSFAMGESIAVIDYIDNMSNEEFKAAFRRSLDLCTARVVSRMREEAKK